MKATNNHPTFRTRVYHASLTTERTLVLCSVGLACIAIIGYGIGANVAGSSAGNGFMGLGLVLMILAALFVGPTHQSSLKITDEAVTWNTGRQTLTIPWQAVMKFDADPPSKRWFRHAFIHDGTRTIVVSSYVFREYDQIVSLLEVAMRTHWRGAGTASSKK
ncbi:MAG: hypothetical protein ACOX9B_06570 [Candidatus Xenobium sp.]